MKPIIGILNNLKVNENEGPYAEYYMANKVYMDRLKESGGLGLSIYSADEEILDKCDGFLLIGGHRITSEHYKVIEYAIKHNKPLLGICNGCQAIILYDYLYTKCYNPTVDNLMKKYSELRENKVTILEQLEGHGSELSQRKIEFNMDTINARRHSVNLYSELKNIYGVDTINVASIHTYGFHNVTSNLEVIAKSDDGVVEGVKYKNKPIIGVQFHAELDDNIVLFQEFIKKCS